MAEHNFLVSLSVVNRNIQKYFDKVLAPYGIGYGQIMFLLLINEHEGITMQEISKTAEVDKGTTTKSIQRLLEQGYVAQHQDENDRRVRRLYTTQKASEIMSDLYDVRNECRSRLSRNVNFNENFEDILDQITVNSRQYLNPEPLYSGIKIGGLQKMTLQDYPGKMATTVFTGGCPFKCPYCYKKDLVFLPEGFEFLDPEAVLAYLQKRKGLLDAVCISGGEPFVQEGLMEFLKAIKDMGYLIKLDTNGYYPDRLQQIVETGMIDYVAMDIKNCIAKYPETCGLSASAFDASRIEASAAYLMQGTVQYEFRTTVVRELHQKEDLTALARWIHGAERWYLQQYQDSPDVIQPGLHAYDKEEMEAMQKAVREYVPHVMLRGIREG